MPQGLRTSWHRRFLTCSWNQVDLCKGAVCLLGITRSEGLSFHRGGVRSDDTCRAPGINPRAACFVHRQAGQSTLQRPHSLTLRCLNGDLWKRSDCPLLERLCYFCWRKRASHWPRACVRSEDDCGRQAHVFVRTPSRSESNEAQKSAPGASGPPAGDLRLRWSPMDGTVQRRRERQ